MSVKRQPVSVLLNLALGALLVVFITGCRTPSPFPAVDLTQGGWTQKQYQVVWKTKTGANELICDVLEANHSSGKTFVQVSKTPLVLATVQADANLWWVEYGPRPRYGKGAVIPKDAEHLWVLIAKQRREATNLKVEAMPDKRERWSNLKTGERIEGVPAP